MCAFKKFGASKKIEPKKSAVPAKAEVKKAVAPAPAPAPAPKKATAPAKPAPSAKPATKPGVSKEQRYRMVEEAAYYLAEKDGFRKDSGAYWLEAEKQIAAQLGGGCCCG